MGSGGGSAAPRRGWWDRHGSSRRDFRFQPSRAALSEPHRRAAEIARQARRANEPHRPLAGLRLSRPGAAKGGRKGEAKLIKDGRKVEQKQLLHLVFGGELTKLDKVEFKDLKAVDIVGIYPNYAE